MFREISILPILPFINRQYLPWARKRLNLPKTRVKPVIENPIKLLFLGVHFPGQFQYFIDYMIKNQKCDEPALDSSP